MRFPAFIAIWLLALSGVIHASTPLFAQTNLPALSETNEPTKTCFLCNGTGVSGCVAPTCRNGQVDCPGPCLKLSKGTWVHMQVEGHGPNELWQRFPTAQGGMMSWNQNHCGEVIQMQNGNPVDLGACKICGGTSRVTCKVCGGKGIVTCVLCGGKNVVPASWTAFDNPRMKNRPNLYKLKDGRELRGRTVMASGGTTLIRTEKGDVKIPTAEILSEKKQTTAK